MYNTIQGVVTTGGFYSQSAGIKLWNADYNNISSVSIEGHSYGLKLEYSEQNNIYSSIFNTSIIDLNFKSSSISNTIYNNSFYGAGVQDEVGGNNYCQEPRNYYAPNASKPWQESACDCIDNDGDGLTDLNDPGCQGPADDERLHDGLPTG